MPELPEVETVLRGLVPVMQGHVIANADIRRSGLRWPFPEHMRERLVGQPVVGMHRRSKYILVDLASGETLIVHLGMTGRMTIHLPKQAVKPGRFHQSLPNLEKHDHVVLEMETGARVVFNDARRFGAMDLVATTTASQHRLLAQLGQGRQAVVDRRRSPVAIQPDRGGHGHNAKKARQFIFHHRVQLVNGHRHTLRQLGQNGRLLKATLHAFIGCEVQQGRAGWQPLGNDGGCISPCQLCLLPAQIEPPTIVNSDGNQHGNTQDKQSFKHDGSLSLCRMAQNYA